MIEIEILIKIISYCLYAPSNNKHPTPCLRRLLNYLQNLTLKPVGYGEFDI